jgi:diguanylate cyclase (GGDEF)-like protein
MVKLPYIEPTIRTIAGGLVTAFVIALVWLPNELWLWFFLLMFVSLNLFQSGFTRFCLMEKVLKRVGLRSEMAEIQDLAQENKVHRETLDLLDETVIELTTSGQLLYQSANWEKLVRDSKIVSQPENDTLLFDFRHPEDRTSLERLLAKIDVNQIESLRFRLVNQPENENWVEGKFILHRTAKQHALIRGVLRDINDAYLQEQRIAYMAMHDALTGLPNRILLDDRMNIAITQAHRTGKKLAVIFIDLDNFKQVNDTHGHKVGDQLLIEVSTLLKNSLRQSDTLARWGGDEFVVLLPNLDTIEESGKIAENLMLAANQALLQDGVQSLVTLSLGISIFPDYATDIQTLLIQADKAVYFAKAQGRNNFKLFEAVYTEESSAHNVNLNIRLAMAIRNGAIHVQYQPVIAAATGKIIGVEALARWHDEERGWISPSLFIPMAENLGLIHDLSLHIQAVALRDLVQLTALHPLLTLDLNISNHQLAKADFARNLLLKLSELKLPTQQLRLDITESATHHDINSVRTNLQNLSLAGIELSLDNFGTGFSKRSYFNDLPFNELKIDISFIRRIKVSDMRVMVKAIIDMAHAMHFSVVAEGVEDKMAADILIEMGVEKLQGNHYQPPMPFDELLSLLSKYTH